MGGKNNVDAAVAGDAEAVGQNLGGCKCPARAAVHLVANGVNARAPLISGIKRCGEGGGVGLDGRGNSSAAFRQRRVARAQAAELLGRTGPRVHDAEDAEECCAERTEDHVGWRCRRVL